CELRSKTLLGRDAELIRQRLIALEQRIELRIEDLRSSCAIAPLVSIELLFERLQLNQPRIFHRRFIRRTRDWAKGPSHNPRRGGDRSPRPSGRSPAHSIILGCGPLFFMRRGPYAVRAAHTLGPSGVPLRGIRYDRKRENYDDQIHFGPRPRAFPWNRHRRLRLQLRSRWQQASKRADARR